MGFQQGPQGGYEVSKAGTNGLPLKRRVRAFFLAVEM
jgi:hypothetical protein